MGPLEASIHKSNPLERRLPAMDWKPAACRAWVSDFSVKPGLDRITMAVQDVHPMQE